MNCIFSTSRLVYQIGDGTSFGQPAHKIYCLKILFKKVIEQKIYTFAYETDFINQT